MIHLTIVAFQKTSISFSIIVKLYQYDFMFLNRNGIQIVYIGHANFYHTRCIKAKWLSALD